MNGVYVDELGCKLGLKILTWCHVRGLLTVGYGVPLCPVMSGENHVLVTDERVEFEK